MSSKLLIPKDVLIKIVCLNCSNYLSVFPIYTKNDSSGALCGRCKLMEEDKFIRDEAYEGIAQFLVFPCRYANDGCSEHLTPPKLEDHERCCEVRKFDCPSKNYSKCQWKGARANLVEHFEQNHSNLLLTEPSFELAFVSSQEECFLLPQDDELFIVKKVVDARKGIFSCSVEHLKATEDSEVYHHSLKIENGNKNYFYKCPDKSTCESEKMNTTQLTYDILRERLHDPATIIVNILIVKSKIDEEGSHADGGDTNKAIKPEDIKKNPKINWDMLSEIECPICYDYMLAPIYQCINGHSICQGCKSQVTECPVCKKEFQETKNFALEKMTNYMEYPCKFYKNGCQYSCKSTDIKNHENGCEFGPYSCPLTDTLNCTWKGGHSEVNEHIANNHTEAILQSDRVDIAFNRNQECKEVFLIQNNKKTFKLCYKYEAENFYWSVQLVGPANDAKQYRFEVDVIDLSHCRKRCYFTGLVVPLCEQNKSFNQSGKYIIASLQQLESFTTTTFSFRVRVIKDED